MKAYGGHLHPKSGWHQGLSKKEATRRMKYKERQAAKNFIKEEEDWYEHDKSNGSQAEETQEETQ